MPFSIGGWLDDEVPKESETAGAEVVGVEKDEITEEPDE
jgi:hypothetical protein